MKRVIIFIVLIAFVAGCKKFNSLRDDLNGNFYLRGRLFRVNTITNNADTTPIAGKAVNIGYYPDSVNYVYSVTTDVNGYFAFNNLKAGTHYILTTADSSGGILYNAKMDVQLDTSVSSLRFFSYPSTALQNGFLYNVTDVSNAPVNGCAVCAFASQYLFHQAVAADTCIGASYNLTTNPFGRAYQLNTPPLTYYVFFRFRFSKTVILRDSDVVTVQQQGITRRGPVIVR